MACPAASTFRLLLDWDMVLQRYDPDRGTGPVIEPEELALTTPTIDALSRWYRAYSDLAHGPEPGGDDDDADWRLLEDEGLRLWSIIRQELGPTCRVYYSSVLFHQTFASPDEYEQVVGGERSRPGRGPSRFLTE